MIINITVNETDLESLEKLNSLISKIKFNARDLETEERKIDDLHSAIEALVEIREAQIEKINDLKESRDSLLKIRAETDEIVKSEYEEITETMNETLSILGFNRAFVEDRIDDVEKAVRYNRRNGFFKSSEQGAVYEKLSAIGNYLKEFPELENRVLEDFSDLHVKKLFSIDFDKVRSSLDDFKLSESARLEIEQLDATDNPDEPEQARRRILKP
ncbi:hypothetical protein SOX05_08720 [Pseudomonas putida]|nr:hypothetical protein [Pseudomonas putida]MDY4319344.1 hypothetical protein [Pseudomonas putida]MDY4352729.1 hypothetical protein [Pseudomonas putida]